MGFQKLGPDVIRQHKGVSFTGISTVFFCHDGSGHIFLTKRSNNARDEHGTWDPGAGGLKHGVAAIDNLTRELKEEYNANPLRIDFLGYRDVFRQNSDGTPTHWLALDFAVLVDPKQVKINEPDMIDASDWFTLDTLPEPLHSQFPLFLKVHGKKIQKLINQPQ